jgi:hypothetical protein
MNLTTQYYWPAYLRLLLQLARHALPSLNSTPLYRKVLLYGWVAEWFMAPVLKFDCADFLKSPEFSKRLRNTAFFVVFHDFTSQDKSIKIRQFQKFGEQFGEQARVFSLCS